MTFRLSRLIVPACPLAAVGVLIAGLAFAGDPQPSIAGLPSPGPLTIWGLPLVRLAHDGAAALTVGTLLAATVLVSDAAERPRLQRAAGWTALGWAVSAVLAFLFTLSDFVGLPLDQALASDALVSFAFYIPQGEAFLTVAATAAVIAAGSRLPAVPQSRAALTALALFALLPPAYVGHSASAADHDLAVSSLMLHITAAAVWIGGLAAVLLFLRRSPGLPAAVARFSVLALACFIAVGVSGTVNAWIRLGDPARLWDSAYGLLVLGKLAALLVLGLFGRWHRRRTVAAIARDGRGFLRLAGGEVAVMAATVGLAVALSRTAPPEGEEVLPDNGLLGYELPPFTAARLLDQVRPDPIVLLALLAAALLYLGGVLRLARSGAAWPTGRVLAWLSGLLLLAYALAGGLAAYGPALFSAHAAQYALIGAAAPALLVFGAPLTLALQSVRPGAPFADLPGRIADGRLAARLSHPVAAFAVFALPYLLMYLTGLAEAAQADHAVRLAAQAVFVLTGTLFLAVVLGVDPLPRPLTIAVRMRLLLAALALQAGVPAVLLAGPVTAQEWYDRLALPWAPDRLADQRLGAWLGTGIAAGVLLCLAAVLARRHAVARRLRRVRRSEPVTAPSE